MHMYVFTQICVAKTFPRFHIFCGFSCEKMCGICLGRVVVDALMVGPIQLLCLSMGLGLRLRFQPNVSCERGKIKLGVHHTAQMSTEHNILTPVLCAPK